MSNVFAIFECCGDANFTDFDITILKTRASQ